MFLNGAEDETDMIEQQRKVQSLQTSNKRLQEQITKLNKTTQFFANVETKVTDSQKNIQQQNEELLKEI